MTKKDIESVKRIVKNMLDEMLFEEDITYDDNKPLYADENFTNYSETNWKYISRGDK